MAGIRGAATRRAAAVASATAPTAILAQEERVQRREIRAVTAAAGVVPAWLDRLVRGPREQAASAWETHFAAVTGASTRRGPAGDFHPSWSRGRLKGSHIFRGIDRALLDSAGHGRVGVGRLAAAIQRPRRRQHLARLVLTLRTYCGTGQQQGRCRQQRNGSGHDCLRRTRFGPEAAHGPGRVEKFIPLELGFGKRQGSSHAEWGDRGDE
jgi:hypothetical protein